MRSPFRHLLYANIATAVGDWIGLVAILALTEAILPASRATAFALASVMAARIVPAMLLGPVAGVLADRWNRRQLLVGTDLVRGVIFLALPFVDDFSTLILVTIFVEVMSTVFIPAKDAIVPQLVPEEHLTFANQLSMVSTYGTMPIGGFAYAGLVYLGVTFAPEGSFIADNPLAVALWFDAATYFVSALFLSRLRGIDVRVPRVHDETDRPGAWAELVEGLRFIANKPVIRALVFGVAGAFLGAGAALGLGELFVAIVGGGDSGLGFLQGFLGTGLIAGIVVAGPLEKRVTRERMFAPALMLAGTGLMATSLMPTLLLGSLLAGVTGFGGGIAFIAGYTMLQDHSHDAIRGRTMAAFNTGVRGAMFAGLVLGPLIPGVFGVEGDIAVSEYALGPVRLTLMAAGLVTVAGAVYTYRAIHSVVAAEEDLNLTDGGTPTRVGAGLFVSFEGGEGAGKSTQVRLLRGAVERAGFDATVTREPGGTAIGEKVRRILLDPASAEMGERAEALLYAAARAQHVDEVILPALDKGHVVLCDRYIDSSVVYQGVARDLGDVQIAELNRWATGEVLPDLVVVLDIDPVEGLRRAGEDKDRLESAGLDFHRRVNQAFRQRAAQEPDRYLLLDASLPAEDLHARIRDAVLARMALANEVL